MINLTVHCNNLTQYIVVLCHISLFSFDEVASKLQELTSEATVTEVKKAIIAADKNSNGNLDYAGT